MQVAIELVAPYGTTIRQFSNMSYQLMFDSSHYPQVRDWFAGLAQKTAEQGVAHLEQQLKLDKEQRKHQLHTQSKQTKADKLREQIEALKDRQAQLEQELEAGGDALNELAGEIAAVAQGDVQETAPPSEPTGREPMIIESLPPGAPMPPNSVASPKLANGQA